MAVLWPQTFMNEAGRSAGPARGSYKLPLERVVAVHDEIDIPFGEVRTRLGGGLAGHNGLKSLRRELGGADFWRVRVGVGRPDSTDPEIVSAHVLGRFRESPEEVRELVRAGGRRGRARGARGGVEWDLMAGPRGAGGLGQGGVCEGRGGTPHVGWRRTRDARDEPALAAGPGRRTTPGRRGWHAREAVRSCRPRCAPI